MYLIPGTVLSCEKAPGINHVGVVVGPDLVFHNAPGRGEHVSSVEAFAQGRPVKATVTGVSPALVLDRVRTRLTRPRAYDVFSSNCDHSVTAVLQGSASSPQLQGFGVITALTVLAVVAFSD